MSKSITWNIYRTCSALTMLAMMVGAISNSVAQDLASRLPRTTSLKRAHAHNDYLHTRPLLDALDNGFASAEADIYLVDGELLVAHDRKDLTPERSLKRLYLEPLAKRIKQNQGRVYSGSDQVFTLLVDIKSEASSTYSALEKELAAYQDWLTQVEGDQKRLGAVEVIVSGNRPRELMLSQPTRLASYDGRISDLGTNTPPLFMPLVSERWGALFRWNGEGAMPPDQQEKLSNLVQQAHAEGYRLRFWATPESVAVWRKLLEMDVDHINTDDLTGLSRFLLEHDTSR
jgi:hypothetical protein